MQNSNMNIQRGILIMTYEKIDKLPEKKGIIGAKEIIKAIKAGNVKLVIVASNCPDFLINKIEQAGSVQIKQFSGNQKELGTRLGKPFIISMVGFE